MLHTGGRVVADLAAAAVRVVYPPRCMTCDTPVLDPGTLCAPCWTQTPFITGLACDGCGAPLPGTDDQPVLCDDCLRIARPWGRGRAVLRYHGNGRRLVLGLKYADRHDTARHAGPWLARRAAALIRPDTVIAPVPLHWLRLFRRRYNQAALLAQALGRAVDRPVIPDLLTRRRHTPIQDGLSREGRFANLRDAIAPHPRRAGAVCGRHVLLVDDVMTSGATLAAATEACFLAGADAVDVIVLARVLRDG